MRVLVLGAGVVGVAAAYHLAQAGHAVAVIERREGPALEASWGNAGELLGSTSTPWLAPGVPAMVLRTFGRRDAPYLVRPRADPAMWLWALRFLVNCRPSKVARVAAALARLGAYSQGALHAVRALEGIEYAASTRGILHLYRSPAAFERAAAHAADPARRADVLDRAGCEALEPALAGSRVGIAGGLLARREEAGDSHLFATALAGRAMRLGAVFRYDTTVRALRIRENMVTGIETDRGTSEADATVLCLGTGSRALLRRVGIRVPIYPVKGYSATYPVTGRHRAPAIAIHEGAWKIGITPFGDRLRVAGTAEFDGHNRRIDPERMAALVARLKALFPDGADYARACYWTGLRPMTPDCMPILGTTPYAGLYLNTGHGSLGWTLACGSGRVIADLVSGREPEIDVAALRLERWGRQRIDWSSHR